MNRRFRNSSIWAGIGLCLWSLIGCDYSAPDSLDISAGAPQRQPLPRLPERAVQAGGNVAGAPVPVAAPRAAEERTAILDSSITLIQRAALQPGGRNYELAVKKLNHYFEGTPLSTYELPAAMREYLSQQLSAPGLKELENRNWNPRDTRHIEDCMMYYTIANRVAGTGEGVERVRRVFDWVVQQVQLVPPNSLAAGRLPHAFARPYDVLLRGMATEADGIWAERSWLFMVLCRQLGFDAGLVTYTRSDTLDARLPNVGSSSELEASLSGARKPPKPPVIWITTVLIDDKAYLFDARVGLPVPGRDGSGVATLEDALSDSAVLERMNLPGLVPYATSRASLLGSPTKIGILLDSSPGYFSPKMRLLQDELSGKYRTVLYRDPAAQRDQFVKVLGKRAGSISLWPLPLEVETRLFTDSQYVTSIQASLLLFRPEFPLVYARVKQLRGELDEAVQDYVGFRLKDQLPLVNNKKQMIPREIQDGLDIYATYYLGLAQLERNNLDQAELMFTMTLKMLPEPGPSQRYFNMFRWGASANLGRIHEAKKQPSLSVAYYTQRDPTPQYVGNLLRAREIVWADPLGNVAAQLPPAPPPR